MESSLEKMVWSDELVALFQISAGKNYAVIAINSAENHCGRYSQVKITQEYPADYQSIKSAEKFIRYQIPHSSWI